MAKKTVYFTKAKGKRYKGIVKALRSRGHPVIVSDALERESVRGRKSLSSYKKPRKARMKPKRDTMARKKARIVYRTRKAKTRRKKSGMFGSGLMNDLVPLGIATVSEPILDTYARQLPLPSIMGIGSDDLVKLGVGIYLGKKGGMIGKVAKYYGIFGARNIIQGLAGNVLGGQQPQANSGW